MITERLTDASVSLSVIIYRFVSLRYRFRLNKFAAPTPSNMGRR